MHADMPGAEGLHLAVLLRGLAGSIACEELQLLRVETQGITPVKTVGLSMADISLLQTKLAQFHRLLVPGPAGTVPTLVPS